MYVSFILLSSSIFFAVSGSDVFVSYRAERATEWSFPLSPLLLGMKVSQAEPSQAQPSQAQPQMPYRYHGYHKERLTLVSNFIFLFILFKALDVAEETFIRINEEGIMCIQHQVLIGLKEIYCCNLIFIFFFCFR